MLAMSQRTYNWWFEW